MKIRVAGPGNIKPFRHAAARRATLSTLFCSAEVLNRPDLSAQGAGGAAHFRWLECVVE